MSPELIIAIASFLGALTSMVFAVASFRREEVKSDREGRQQKALETERKKTITASVAEDTVGLYKRLSEQYSAINAKDKELLRTITFVIRHLVVLERTVVDFLSEMEEEWEEHEKQAENINCPFYFDMDKYMYSRVAGIEEIISETMEEVNSRLLNGNGTTDHNKE